MSEPMRLPVTGSGVAAGHTSPMPTWLPEMTCDPVASPWIVLAEELSMRMPS